MEDLSRAVWLRRLIVATLLAGLVLLAFQVLRPFIVPVIWAIILAYVTWPAHEALARLLGGRRGVSALAMTVVLAGSIVVPATWLVTLLQVEVLGAYREFVRMLASGPKIPPALLDLPVLGEWLRKLLERLSADPAALNAEVRGLLDNWSGEVGVVVGGIGRNLAKLAAAMLTLFFMYRDGRQYALQLSLMLQKFLGQRVDDYLEAIGATVKAVVYGLVLAALAQGALAGLGYWVAGLEAPVFLGALTAIVALIPFAVPFMWVGASLWLLLSGETVAAAGLFAWGLTAVSWVDNIIRPLVISGATRIPFLLVMFGVLGGLAAFGLVGLFIGPVILAVLIAIWREWLEENRSAPLQ
jgi:predicted PurR-regulated permease PerM